MSDEELWAAYVSGDDAAFTDLANRYQEPLVNYATKLGLPLADSEEVVQETMAKIAEHRRSLGRFYFRPLLYKVTFGRVMDRMRANRRGAKRLATVEMRVFAEVYVR